MVMCFIAGHGRCDPEDKKQLPQGVSVKWYGEMKKSVTKRFTKAVLAGNLDEIGESSSSGVYSEHYLCETLELEAVLRTQAFQTGFWDVNTYMIQAKLGYCIKLSQLIVYAQGKWPGQPLDLHWAVCRSSLIGGGVLTHDYDPLTQTKFFRVSSGAAAPSPGNKLINAINDNTVWLTRWQANLVAGPMSPMPQSINF